MMLLLASSIKMIIVRIPHPSKGGVGGGFEL